MTQGESNSYQGGEAASYQATGGNNQQPYGYPKPDISQAAHYAKQHAQDDDDDDDKEHIFTSVLSKLQTHDENPHLNETEADHAAHAHEKVYNQNNSGQASSRDLGSAAAMQAFKMFSSNKSSSNGGGSSNELVGLAMGEAMKLFKSQGGSSSGANQSEMLQQAAMMAMKLFMTQQTSGQQGGASSGGGGLGQVMGILSSLNGQPQQQPPKHSSGVSSLLSKFL